MAVKCTECGASIQDDSKFCKYCGAKIVLDEIKKIEVKIDDTAEIKRAGYEEQESILRQKMMKRELRMKGLKWKVTGVFNALGLLCFIFGYITGPAWLVLPGILGLLGPYLVMFMQWMNK